MSGRGAPARTAMPMLERARSARLPETTRPALISSSMPLPAMITTSVRSPRCSRSGIESGAPATDPPETMISVSPVARSKIGVSSFSAADSAPDVMTRISAACAATAVSSTKIATRATVRAEARSARMWCARLYGGGTPRFGYPRITRIARIPTTRRPAPAAKRPGRASNGPCDHDAQRQIGFMVTRSACSHRAALPRRRTSTQSLAALESAAGAAR